MSPNDDQSPDMKLRMTCLRLLDYFKWQASIPPSAVISTQSFIDYNQRLGSLLEEALKSEPTEVQYEMFD